LEDYLTAFMEDHLKVLHWLEYCAPLCCQ